MTTHQITNKYRATVGDGDGIEYRTQIINDKIEQFIDAMKKMRTLEGQEVEAILSNGTLLSDWLRTTLTTYGTEREALGVALGQKYYEEAKHDEDVWRNKGREEGVREEAENREPAIDILKEALRGEGAYSQDPLAHARNTIDNMFSLIQDAIDSLTIPCEDKNKEV